jgi:hypothetical protein
MRAKFRLITLTDALLVFAVGGLWLAGKTKWVPLTRVNRAIGLGIIIAGFLLLANDFELLDEVGLGPTGWSSPLPWRLGPG